MVEQKGLDIVRRDWCPLSKDVGNFALQQILSGQPREEVVEAVHAKLHEVGQGSALSAVHKTSQEVTAFFIIKTYQLITFSTPSLKLNLK